MSDARLADSEPLPGMPMLPAVATIVPVGGPPAIPVQLDPGFFEFLSRLVQQIKSSEAYDEADGILLKIVGPEVPLPDPEIVPEVKYRLGPNGRPILIVKKSPFQGSKVDVARGSSPAVEAGFSSSREDELPLALPAPGQAEVWTVQVQYRYRNAPFGQKSMPLEIPVRGS